MNRVIVAATLLLAALSGACASEVPPSTGGAPGNMMRYAVMIDPGLDAASSQAYVDGFATWSARISELTLDVSVGACQPNDSTICVSAGTAALQAASSDAGFEILGLTQRDEAADSAQIYTFPMEALPASEAAEAALHEIGHALGLQHTWAQSPTGNATLMCATVNCGVPDITATDIAQFWSLRQ